MLFVSLPITFIISLCLCALAFPLSYLLGAIDMPDGVRKLSAPKPRLIGIGFIIAFFLSAFIFFFEPPYLLPLTLSASVLLLGTFFDDTVGISPFAKLGFQALSLVILISLTGAPLGVRLLSFSLSLSYPVSFLITLLLGLIIINAANVIDGLDTLLLSLALISLIFISAASLTVADSAILKLSLTLFFALLAFLPYNKPSAKGFMGDTGAQFIGLFIFFAILTLCHSYGSGDILTPPTDSAKGAGSGFFDLSLLLLFFLPIIELALSFSRRLLCGKSPFAADNGHLHYRLKKKGLSTEGVVLVLCSFHFIFCILYFIIRGI